MTEKLHGRIWLSFRTAVFWRWGIPTNCCTPGVEMLCISSCMN